MQAAGQDAGAAEAAFKDALPKALEKITETRFRFEFLATPVRVMGDWMNGVTGLKVEENTLVLADGTIKARVPATRTRSRQIRSSLPSGIQWIRIFAFLSTMIPI